MHRASPSSRPPRNVLPNVDRRGAGIVICCVTLLIAAATTLPAYSAQKDDPPPASATLEEGEGRDVVVQKCATCHDLERIPARRRDKLGWEDLVDNMRSRGAEMTSEERDKIVNYLNEHYGIPD